MKRKSVLIIGYGSIGIDAAMTLERLKLSEIIQVVDLNEISSEEAIKKLKEDCPEPTNIYPKSESFILENREPMSECYIDKPKKPRHNPKTGKTKYF